MLILCLMPICASFISFAANLNFLVSTILFFGLPAAYLSYRTPFAIKRSLAFSGVVTLGLTFAEYYGELDQNWYVASMLPRVFGYIAIEAVIWGFLLTYFIVIFYEHFIDKGRHKDIGKGLKYLLVVLTCVFVLIFTLNNLNPTFTHYFYFKMGVLMILMPIVVLLIIFPKYMSMVIKITPYFFALGILNELTGVPKGYWTYPGSHLVGWVNIGSIRFPIEEVIFWMVLFTSATILYLEFFDDNSARLPQRTLKKIKSFAK